MDLRLSPLSMIEGGIYGKDGWVRVSVDKVGCRVIQVDQEVLTLTACLDEAGSEGIYCLICTIAQQRGLCDGEVVVEARAPHADDLDEDHREGTCDPTN